MSMDILFTFCSVQSNSHPACLGSLYFISIIFCPLLFHLTSDLSSSTFVQLMLYSPRVPLVATATEPPPATMRAVLCSLSHGATSVCNSEHKEERHL
jgi:hypothetical protein